MTIDSMDFDVPPGKPVNPAKWPTHGKRAYKSKKNYRSLLEAQVEELSYNVFTTRPTATRCC